MPSGLSGLRAYQEGGPVLDKLKRLWEGLRDRADNPEWKDLPWHVAPITGELSDLVEVGAGLQDRSLGRVGLGLAGLALPFVGAPALRKLFKGRKKIRPLDAQGMTRPRLGPVEGPPFRATFLSDAERARRARILPPARWNPAAEKMGLDLDLYHGTQLGFKDHDIMKVGSGRFGPGVYTSTSPKDAEEWLNLHAGGSRGRTTFDEWAKRRGADGPRIYPLKARSRKLIEYGGKEWTDLADELEITRISSQDSGWAGYGDYSWDDNAKISKLARERGYEGVFNPVSSERLYKPGEYMDSMDELMEGTEVMIFDPKNVRSRYAAFDPKKRHVANLGAGIAGLTGVRYMSNALREDRGNG